MCLSSISNAAIHCSNLKIDCFLYLYTFVVDAYDFDLQSTFTSNITSFHGLLHVLMNGVVIEFNSDDYRTNYQFIYYYWVSFIHDKSIMVYLFITLLKSIIYDVTQCMKPCFNYLNDKQDENKSNIDETDQSYCHLHRRSINVILMCIATVTCSMYFIDSKTDQLLCEEMIFSYRFMHLQIIFILTEHSSVQNCYRNQAMYMAYILYISIGLLVVVSCLWYAVIHSRNSSIGIDYFIDIYTIYIHDTIIKTIDIYFQAMLTSIIILIQISTTFTNCIAIGFNSGPYGHKYLSYCLSLIYSIMISFLITSSQASIYDIIQWIKQYVNDLNDTIDRNRLKNDKTSPSVDMYNILIKIMELKIILSIDSFYIVIHHVLFENLH